MIQFDSLDFDFTLEMSQLCTYGVKIDCEDLRLFQEMNKGEKYVSWSQKGKTLSFKFCYGKK